MRFRKFKGIGRRVSVGLIRGIYFFGAWLNPPEIERQITESWLSNPLF